MNDPKKNETAATTKPSEEAKQETAEGKRAAVEADAPVNEADLDGVAGGGFVVGGGGGGPVV